MNIHQTGEETGQHLIMVVSGGLGRQILEQGTMVPPPRVMASAWGGEE